MEVYFKHQGLCMFWGTVKVIRSISYIRVYGGKDTKDYCDYFHSRMCRRCIFRNLYIDGIDVDSPYFRGGTVILLRKEEFIG